MATPYSSDIINNLGAATSQYAPSMGATGLNLATAGQGIISTGQDVLKGGAGTAGGGTALTLQELATLTPEAQAAILGGQGNQAALIQALGPEAAALLSGGQAGAAGLSAGLAPIAGATLGGGVGAETALINQLFPQASSLMQQGAATEQGGPLPAGLAASVDQQTQQAIAQIKGKYASLGMSGSTAEADEIANAQNQNMINKGQLGFTLGGQEFGQGQNLASLIQGTAGTLGTQGTNLSQILSGLATSGTTAGISLSQLLAQLSETQTGQGLTLQGMSSADISKIIQAGLQSMQIGVQETGTGGNIANAGVGDLGAAAGVYDTSAKTLTDLATQQMTADQNMQNTVSKFFGAIAGNQGLFGNQGLIPGGGSFLSSLGIGGGAAGGINIAGGGAAAGGDLISELGPEVALAAV